MERSPRRPAQIAELLREDLSGEYLPQAIEAARKLYPAMAPSPTARGYWHIRTRTGFEIPRFDRQAHGAAGSAREHEFCAIYYEIPAGGKRGGDGMPRTLFAGGFSDSSYDVVDRTFRVLADEVLEPAWAKLNRARGRRAGGLIGVPCGFAAAVAMAAAAWLYGWLDPVYDFLAGFPPAYRLSVWAAAGALALIASVSVCSTVFSRLGGAWGGWCERMRLKRRLSAVAEEFRYGSEVTGPLCNEFAVVMAEERKEREFRRYEEAGISLTRGDFARIVEHLPYIKQLALTEDRRREEVLALAARVGAESPLDVMTLIEPYLNHRVRTDNTTRPHSSYAASER